MQSSKYPCPACGFDIREKGYVACGHTVGNYMVLYYVRGMDVYTAIQFHYTSINDTLLRLEGHRAIRSEEEIKKLLLLV